MDLLTNSSKSCYQECPRKYQYSYELGYRPVKDAEPLVFGTAWHKCMEELFKGNSVDAIIKDIQEDTENDQLTKIKLSVLLRGYIDKWGKPQPEEGTEKEFKIPLINPKTGKASRTWELAGKIDVACQGYIIEHKTTSDDVGNPESPYWLKLQIDPQITGYCIGAESLGYKVNKVLYDVVKKPKIAPAKATPIETRKYTKTGALYASQRENDETLEEFGKRFSDEVLDNLDKYFARREIGRMEEDLVEFLEDCWSVGRLIALSRNNNHWPRRTNQCFVYGKCQYWEVCAKMDSLYNEERFKKLEQKNPELKEVTYAV